MKLLTNIFSTIILTAVSVPAVSAQSLDITNGDNQQSEATQQQVSVGSQKRSDATKVRNLIKEGNRLYNDQRYAEAEVCYGKALELDPNSSVAQFNLAASLLKNSGNSDPSDSEGPLMKAAQMLQNLTRTSDNASVVEKSFYNLGNMAFNQQQYGQSIEMYQNVLRRNPDNDKARQNLRLAQLKQQEQQQNQDQNQDQQQDQQDQQQDQQQQDQQNQNQDQQQQQQNQQQNQQQQQMSDANAEKILKAMENEEAATRRRIEAQKAKEQNSNRRITEKPW